MRADIPLGSQFAQLVHAAGLSFAGPRTSRGSPIAVALAASNEAILFKLEQKLIKAGIAHVAFREPDMNNELTAIGITPDYRRKLRKFVSNYPLIR